MLSPPIFSLYPHQMKRFAKDNFMEQFKLKCRPGLACLFTAKHDKKRHNNLMISVFLVCGQVLSNGFFLRGFCL